MLNVLKNAIPNLTGLLKQEKITIVNLTLKNVNGFPVSEVSRLETYAHIQPLNPNEIQKITSGTLDTAVMYRFYIIDNLADVLNSINNKDSLIEWNERRFKVYSKTDWSLNGWIVIYGTETQAEVTEDV